MSVARNALLNLIGHVAPLAAAVVALPPLVSRLDPERFGFLSLAWVLVGYFSLFDLGFGRALSRIAAERAGTPRESELPALSRVALISSLVLGGVAGAVLITAAEWICAHLLRLPNALQPEAVTALKVLAICLPFVTGTSALRGLLEAANRFGWVNVIRVALGVLTFVAPLVCVFFTSSLRAMAGALVAVRILGAAAHWLACTKLCAAWMPDHSRRFRGAAEMLAFGGWLTVSNTVGPLMAYVDRFVIATLVSVAAVAFYTVPYEALTRLWVVPAAICGVLFPAFAASHAARPDRSIALYRSGLKAVLLAAVPPMLLATLFANEGLTIWVGAEYAQRGARVAQLLAFGVLVNCLAYIPFTLLQASGRADLPAKLHLVELPLYLGALYVFVPRYGIEGAALAWSIRCIADALGLFVLAQRRLPASSPVLGGTQLLATVVALAAVPAAAVPESVPAKLLYLVLVAATLSAIVWFVLLDPRERALLRRPLALLSADEASR